MTLKIRTNRHHIALSGKLYKTKGLFEIKSETEKTGGGGVGGGRGTQDLNSKHV